MGVVDDTVAAYTVWKEAAPGSYLERAMADMIVHDLVPVLIQAAQKRPVPLGFGSETSELESAATIATASDGDDAWDDEPDCG